MSAGAAPTTTPASVHVDALPSVVKDEARAASAANDDSLLNFVFAQVGSLIQGGSGFGQQQIDVLKKTAADVATQLQSAAQIAVSSVDQAKLKEAAGAALGVRETLSKSAASVSTNVTTGLTQAATTVQATATRAVELSKPKVEAAVAGVKDSIAALPATATKTIETARATALDRAVSTVNAVAGVATGAVSATQKATTDAVVQARQIAQQTHEQTSGLTVKGQEMATYATGATLTAFERLEQWIKEQHAVGKDVNATTVQRVVAALASTEAAKVVQQNWEKIKANNAHTTPEGATMDIAEVQQQVAAKAATSAVAVVNAASPERK